MLADLLRRNRAAVLQRWFRLILNTYAHDAAAYWQREKDPFLNPIGHTISQEIGVVYDELLGAGDAGRLASSLDSIVRIRAVQDLSPAEAVGFVFLLKRAIREELAGEAGDRPALEEILGLESRIDDLVLLAFDMYAKRREKIHEIRANEIRAHSARVWERLHRIYGDPGEAEADLGPSNTKRGNAE